MYTHTTQKQHLTKNHSRHSSRIARKVSRAVQTKEARERNLAVVQLKQALPDKDLPLQKTIGNQEAHRLLQSGAIQAKLKIGHPGDKYEQVADRVADMVRSDSFPMQQNVYDFEQDLNPNHNLNTKENIDSSGNSSFLYRAPEPVNGDSKIEGFKDSGDPLTEEVKEYFEPRFGRDFSKVKVHNNTDSNRLAEEINARAFTTGAHIAFAQGQYQPSTNEGKRLLAHELTHVVQQVKTVHCSNNVDAAREKPKVIELNELTTGYYFDLINAINEYAKKGIMVGHIPEYIKNRENIHGNKPWADNDKNPLYAELSDWAKNARDNVIDNYSNFIIAFVDMVAKKIFTSVPGFSVWEQDFLSFLSFLIDKGFGLIKPQYGDASSLAFDIFVNHLSEKIAEYDLKVRISKFNLSIMKSKLYKNNLLDDLENIETLSNYYLMWLIKAKLDEIPMFRIPSLPRKVSEETIREAMLGGTEKAIKGETEKDRDIDIFRAKLFYFVQEIGALIDNININKIWLGESGYAKFREPSKFPPHRFENPYILYDERPKRGEDGIWISVKEESVFTGKAGQRVQKEIPTINIYYPKTRSVAKYDWSNKKWLTGMPWKEFEQLAQYE